MADERGYFPFESKRQKLDRGENVDKESSLVHGLNTSSRPYYEDQSPNLRGTGAKRDVETMLSDTQPWQAQLIGEPEVDKTDIPCEPGCSQYAGVNNNESPNVTPDDEGDCSNTSGIDSDSDESLDLRLGSWQPELEPGPMSWVQQKMLAGVNPMDLLHKMLPQGTVFPEGLDEFTMWKIIISILSEPRRRKKLDSINTMDDVLHLLRTKSKIVVLTGAGVSVSCGIPDFRSRDGIYARLAVDFPDLPDPQAMFDISYFWTNPRPFFKFAKEIYPGQFQPSVSHKFIALLEQHKKLLRNYTQNIDTLEQVANITKVVQCHGSFATASCTRCHYQVDCEAIREDIFNQVVPQCPRCQLPEDSVDFAVMKPDIVFFGEGLPAKFHKQIDEDREEADLLIVIGSSLKVRPVALIPHSIPGDIPQILINREPLPHMEFDVELLGDCDGIINELCHRLGPGFNHLCSTQSPLRETRDIPRSVYECMPMPPYESGSDTQFTFLDELSQTESALNSDKDGGDVPSEVEMTGDSCCCSTSPGENDTGQGEGDKGCQTTNEKPSQDPSQQLKQELSQEASHELSQEPLETPTKDPSGEVQNGAENRTVKMQCEKPKAKNLSIATYLSENTYLHIPPWRYVFKGAEVYPSDCMFNTTRSDESESDVSSVSSRQNAADISDVASAAFDSSCDGQEDGNCSSERLQAEGLAEVVVPAQSQDCGKVAAGSQESRITPQECEPVLFRDQQSTEAQLIQSRSRECGAHIQQTPKTDTQQATNQSKEYQHEHIGVLGGAQVESENHQNTQSQLQDAQKLQNPVQSCENSPHIQSQASEKLVTCDQNQANRDPQVQNQDTEKPQVGIQDSETLYFAFQDSKNHQGQHQNVDG